MYVALPVLVMYVAMPVLVTFTSTGNSYKYITSALFGPITTTVYS
jgi:hypothetical protein